MRLPLSIRIFLVLFLLVLMAVAAAVWVTVWQGRKIGEGEVLKDLSNIEAARKRFDDQVFERLQLRTNLISSDPDVAQYLNVSTTDDLGLDSEAADELGLGQEEAPTAAPATTGSVADLLKERKEQYGFDLGIILDPDGSVLARTDQTEAFEQSLVEDPLLKGVIEDLAPAAAYWQNAGQLYQATAAPIVLDEQAVGFLLLADEVDDAAAQSLSDVSGAKVSFWTLDDKALKLGASSLDRDQRTELSSYLTAQSGGMMASLESLKHIERLELSLAGERWTGNVDALIGGHEKPLGAVLTLARAEQSKAAINEMQKWVIGTGLGTLLLALAASWFLARGLLNPVRKLARAARQAADGDYSLHIETGGSDEIGQLSHAFDQLLSSLREKNDMEGYVSELSRFLPDTAGELTPSTINRTVPPTRLKALLIALDLKRFAHDVPAGQEGIFLTQLASLALDAEALARHRGGRLVESNGPIVMLAFEGEQRIVAGFNVLAHLLPRIAAATGGGAAPSAAALEGEVVFGSLPNREPLTALLGTSATQARRLLAEAPPGQILLSPTLARALTPMLGGKELGVGTGMMSGKKFYALLPSDLTRLPALPEPEGMADANATRAAGAPTTPNPMPGARDTPNQTRLAPGMRLGGRFEILGVLGVGGMGMVYKARDVELDDLVALKMLKPGAQIDAGHLDRLKSELKLARKITHPNVLRTYDFGELGGNAFISMEFVRGMTLRYLLSQTGKLPYTAALRLARQVTAGLQAAHEVGVLHRDIKPENVILTPQGNAKLMDFGIARPLRKGEIQSGEEGMFVGTPNYASPEALSGDEVDARADIYSMGIMLTEMFCGKLPFAGGDTMEIYLQHLEKPPIRPATLWAEIPRPLEALILKCLEKKPGARFGSAGDLLAALANLRS